jgi:hypothetical protein
VHGEPYRGNSCSFSAVVLAHCPRANELPKLKSRWLVGMWLGKSSQADLHMVGTREGVVLTRAIRLANAAEYTHDLWAFMQWTPWHLRPGVRTWPRP